MFSLVHTTPVTSLYTESPYIEMHCARCCEVEKKGFKYPNVQDSVKFDTKHFPFAIVRYKIGYSQLGGLRLVGHLPYDFISNACSRNNC